MEKLTTNQLMDQQMQLSPINWDSPEPFEDRIVIDPGSCTIKAGRSGDDSPQITMPNIVGMPSYQYMQGIDEHYFGQDALDKRGVLLLRRPIVHGYVWDWELMEKLLNHTFFNELRWDPEEHPTLITEQAGNSTQNREKMTQIFFESFNVPAFFVELQAVLALYESGRTSGIVIDSGYGVTRTVPISEGHAITDAVLRFDMAGCDLTDYLVKLLQYRGINLTTTAEREVVTYMREQYWYVAQDFSEELQVAENSSELTVTYELPDGNEVDLNNERFKCPQAMFSPELMGMDAEGIQCMTHHSINRCDENIRQQMYGNIVLAGGNTMYPGMRARMEKEIRDLAQRDAKVKVFAPERRQHSAWIGGSILSSLDTFKDMWISKDEYEENGPTIVNRKCF